MNNTDIKEILKNRFEAGKENHAGVTWEQVSERLTDKHLASLEYMEGTGGEPEFMVYDGNWFFVDGSKETPEGRRNLCYDMDARLKRKKFPPESSAWEEAQSHGITLMEENMYFALQAISPRDTKTSSWLATKPDLRKLGGAIFGDHKFGRTFIYHNGADSYYSVRGFRAVLKI